MSHYFDEESKEWKLLKYVPNVGEIVKKWSSVKYIGNCLYLASSDADKSDIYRYHMVNKSWEKLTTESRVSPRYSYVCVVLVTMFMQLVNLVHPRFTVWLTKSGNRVGTICIYLHKKG